MGYACPVCEVPQRDAEHLANHLAFTAMLHADAHETWLDEHAPGWSDGSPADLADRVADLATETDYDEVFEDTAHAHDHAQERGTGEARHGGEPPGGCGAPAVDPGAAARRGGSATREETEAVFREARELTRRMYDEGDGDADVADEEDADAEG
jgi:hypothetical protein